MSYMMLTKKERKDIELLLVLKYGKSSFDIFKDYLMGDLELSNEEVEVISDGEFTAEEAKECRLIR